MSTRHTKIWLMLASLSLVATATTLAQAASDDYLRSDPSYRAYLRWNGFPVDEPAQPAPTAALGMAGKPGHAGPVSLQDDPSYRNYLRWNGFPVDTTRATAASSDAGARGKVGAAPAGAVNVLDDPSYKAYLRWNGFR